MKLRGKSIAASTSVADRCQLLANNLVLAAGARDRQLCLRTISSILYWAPQCTLQTLDEYCEHHRIPIVLMANLNKEWDQVTVVSVNPADCMQRVPYVLDVVCIPRTHRVQLFQRTAMDQKRPRWARTVETNYSYLPKCGILIPQKMARHANQARAHDPVLAGTIQLVRE
mgnify:CR=1 FL=1